MLKPTPTGDWFSSAVLSDGSYGIPKGIVCGYPVRTDGKKWEIVQGVEINAFARPRIDASVKELQEEKALIQGLL
jgi:malate dehydrogenase